MKELQKQPNVSIFITMVVVISAFYACSFDICEEHEFNMLVSRLDGDNEGKIILTIFEKGERQLLAVDGGTRRTHFSKGEYLLQLNSKRRPLPFMNVTYPIELWDSFAKIGDDWYAIDVASSPYRHERPHIKIFHFKWDGFSRKIVCNMESVDCQIVELAISTSGDSLYINNKFDRYYTCSLLKENSMIEEISGEEYVSNIGGSIKLSNQGVFLDMGSYGNFGRWCQ